MSDKVTDLDIRLYFPQSGALSAQQYQETKYRDMTCRVEYSRYGHNRNQHPELTKQGIVRHLRIITVQDKQTREWLYFDKLDKKALKQLQIALTNEVCEKLQLRPKRIDPTKIAPKEMLLALDA